ncbi:MAG: hypothetical protein KKA73_25610 [Chloroflexi bacterium]|nr:hypothetical protein [Chloroflexota bacterium]MBU1751075.1 hypothetical protein [Chloroflexota bacterium]
MPSDLFFLLIMAVVAIIVVVTVIGSIVITILSIALPLGLTGWLFKRARDQAAVTQALLVSGAPAEATILNLWDTGITINDNPRVGLLLELRPLDSAPFQVETTRTISRLQIPLYQPGTVLQVKYDPHDTTKVAIEAVKREPAQPSERTGGESRPIPWALVCPSCGAPLESEPQAGPTIVCSYCNTPVVVPDQWRG